MRIENSRYDANGVNDSSYRHVRIDPADFTSIYTCTDYIVNRRSFACRRAVKAKTSIDQFTAFSLGCGSRCTPFIWGKRRNWGLFWAKRWFFTCLSCGRLHDQPVAEPAEKSDCSASFYDLCVMQHRDFVYKRHSFSSDDNAYKGLAGCFF